MQRSRYIKAFNWSCRLPAGRLLLPAYLLAFLPGAQDRQLSFHLAKGQENDQFSSLVSSIIQGRAESKVTISEFPLIIFFIKLELYSSIIFVYLK